MKSKLKTVEFNMPDGLSLTDPNAVNNALDNFLIENSISWEQFVGYEFDPEDLFKLNIQYIDGPTVKLQIIQDANANHEADEGIIWTTINSYDDLLSIHFLLEASMQHQLENEKDQIIEDIENGKQFAFWFEEGLMKFTR